MSGILARCCAFIDRISAVTGRAVAWLTLLMVVVTSVIVVLRYVFDSGAVWLQESVTWMHAAVFMLGAAYTLQCEDHVRVDVFYRDMSRRRRALVNFLGVVLFVLPFCGYLFAEALDYVRISWQIREISRDAGGLPYPFLPLLKTILLVMPVAVALQGISLALRSLADLGRR